MHSTRTAPDRSLQPAPHNESSPDLIGPVLVSCPKCDTDLGPHVRVTLESAWAASHRPASSEAYLVCPTCRKAWVAALRISSAAFAVEGVAA